MELIIFAITISIFLWWIRRQPKIKYGSLPTSLGQLSCKIGDELVDNNGVVFRGIEVEIHKKLPHIYIDGHTSDSMMKGPRYVFSPDSKISLEGDFDKHFQVYAPPEYKSLALSVLQPDVMALLIDNVRDFDIEIYHNKIRVITDSKVFNQENQETVLKEAMTLLIDRLERRIRVWRVYDEQHTGSIDLDLILDSTTKFGRKNITSFTLATGVILGFIALGVASFGQWLHLQDNPDLQEGSIYMYITALLLFPCLWIATTTARRKRWI